MRAKIVQKCENSTILLARLATGMIVVFLGELYELKMENSQLKKENSQLKVENFYLKTEGSDYDTTY